MLVDSVKIYVEGGRGGSGCQSVYKDLYNRKGVPDGGDGGDGGDIVIKASPNLNTLLKLRFQQHLKAFDGAHGGSNNKTGKRGKDRIISVPPGTVVKDECTGSQLRDLCKANERFVAASGGKGGRGNGSISQAEQGEQGQKRVLRLDLKLVADVGIVGLPNAGKSTLASRLSRAKVKIAPYPFTTKSPVIGVVKCEDDSFVIADMPGLIEGAHSGKGLGDRFLKHIERTSILLHLVDICPLDGSDPFENYLRIEEELRLYSAALSKKQQVIAANKIDMPGSSEKLKAFTEKVGKKVIPVSAVEGSNLDKLVGCLNEKVIELKEESKPSHGKDRYSGSYRQEQPNQ